jgi:hypothetical protein
MGFQPMNHRQDADATIAGRMPATRKGETPSPRGQPRKTAAKIVSAAVVVW